MAAMKRSLKTVQDIGHVVAKHVWVFFREPHNQAVIEDLLTKANIHWPEVKVVNSAEIDSPFAGKTVC